MPTRWTLGTAWRSMRGTLKQRDRSNVLSADNIRDLSRRAFQDAHARRRTAARAAREAVANTIHNADEIGTEAGSFVKETVVGVVQGARDAARTTSVALGEVVLGPPRYPQDQHPVDLAETERTAVESAIESAAAIGIPSEHAAEQASQGIVEAVRQIGADLPTAARAAIEGVIFGAAETAGDIIGSTRTATRSLLRGADPANGQFLDVARSIVDGAIEGSSGIGDHAEEALYAVASETIRIAYEHSPTTGDAVRKITLDAITERHQALSPELEQRLGLIGQRLAAEPAEPAAFWRGRAFWRAGATLVNVGGLDLAASLAYFMLLSFFPLIALIVLIFALFATPSAIESQLSDILVYYFPASRQFLDEALSYLFQAHVTTGFIAVVGIILGSGGLFFATNRAVNRIFGLRPKRLFHATLMQLALVLTVVLLFLLSVGFTVIFRIAVAVGGALPFVNDAVSTPFVFVIEAVAAVIPIILTLVVFVLVYAIIPNKHIRARDATFGALVAVILFEGAKHLFFWFTNIAGQRSVLYGPIASVIILLIWAAIAALIFLYGAALTHESSSLRPDPPPDHDHSP